MGIERQYFDRVGIEVGCSAQVGIAQVGIEQEGRFRILQVQGRCSTRRTLAYRTACCRTVRIQLLK